jgi:hypothetical protein
MAWAFGSTRALLTGQDIRAWPLYQRSGGELSLRHLDLVGQFPAGDVNDGGLTGDADFVWRRFPAFSSRGGEVRSLDSIVWLFLSQAPGTETVRTGDNGGEEGIRTLDTGLPRITV